MKTLTVRQPWASLIITGEKRVENRSWSTKHRGRLVIHSAAGIAKGFTLRQCADLARGVVLGTVDLVDCHAANMPGCGCQEEFASPTGWHWVLADPSLFDEPVPEKGRLGLWDWDQMM